MFPETEDVGSVRPQRPGHPTIAPPSTLDLAPPEVSSGTRKTPVAARTTVPEAPIDEQRQAQGGEVEVRLSRRVLGMLSPTTDADLGQELGHHGFC